MSKIKQLNPDANVVHDTTEVLEEKMESPPESRSVEIRILSEELVNALATYLSTKPVAEASNLYHSLTNSPKAKALVNGNNITII